MAEEEDHLIDHEGQLWRWKERIAPMETEDVVAAARVVVHRELLVFLNTYDFATYGFFWHV